MSNLLLSLWWFALGACVGSFLNVVVYRVPAGLSIVTPGSHCPKCGRPIRWHDNLPIFGWILLSGRCRDCHQTISARYPLVELVTAILFLLVGRTVGLTNGRNLPGPPLVTYQAWGLTLYYLVLLCTLWAAALVEYDGHSVSLWLMLPAAIVGCALPVVEPFLLRVPPSGITDRWGMPLWGVFAGGIVGLFFGWLILARLAPPAQRNGARWGALLVGIFLGWQAAVVLSLATGVLGLLFYVCRNTARRYILPLVGWLALLTLGWILFWRPIIEHWPVLG